MLQAELANDLAITPSYLSQLESDDHPLTPRFAERLANLFPIDWQDFAVDSTEHLAMALREAISDPYSGEPVTPENLERLPVLVT